MPRRAITETKFKRDTESGRRNWYFYWHEPGDRWRRISSGIPIETPEPDVEREFQLWQRTFQKTEQPITLFQVLGAYLADRKDRVKAYSRLEEAVTGIKKAMPDIPPANLTQADWDGYQDKRGISKSTARKELALIRWACKKCKVSLPEYDLPGKLPPQERWLTKEQLNALLARVRAFHLKLFILLAVTTGQRTTSILNLPWSQVDLENNVIDFNDYDREITAKRRAVVPLAAALKPILLHAKKIARTDNVIEYGGKPVKRVYRGIKRYGELLGMPWITPHVLKHTAVSHLATLGHSIESIADMTETSTETITRIYRKVNPEKYRNMADDLGSLFETGPEIVSPHTVGENPS